MVSRISVVVITCGRPAETKAAVHSLLNQSIKPLEILFIDNGSNPPISQETTDNPTVKLTRFNKLVGTSAARNYGIRIARGDYVAFIDDDCLPTTNWLEEINNGIEAGYEILGGPLQPKFMASPPEWLEWSKYRKFWWGVGVGNDRTGEIWGGNMVFKKEVFRKIGMFNQTIGPQGKKRLGFEDVELINRGKKCCKILFMPKAVVFHRITAERMTIRYIARWSYYKGKTDQLILGHKVLETCRQILLALALNVNPSKISKKSYRIRRIAWMAELLGRLL